MTENSLSHDVAPGSEITPCNKIDSGLQIFRKRYDLHNNVAYITCNDKIETFFTAETRFKSDLNVI